MLGITLLHLMITIIPVLPSFAIGLLLLLLLLCCCPSPYLLTWRPCLH